VIYHGLSWFIQKLCSCHVWLLLLFMGSW
jgi:hypothetical protein